MPLIFITGVSTAGKSTVAKELVNRGYEAYDAERHGMTAWYDNKTGKQAAGFNAIPQRTKDWYDQHEWRLSIDRVKELAAKARDKPIFLCGNFSNNKEITALCSTVVWLKTNEKTIKQRVTHPRDHDWGNKPYELATTLANNKTFESEYRKSGAIIIDSTQPIERVVNSVLSSLK